ncbi:MAG: hypothetical protein HY791_24840 [Deltaproteobacteria bacterium]|nr:hypothetical protein [Deltaproteobacteria bacterium]
MSRDALLRRILPNATTKHGHVDGTEFARRLILAELLGPPLALKGRVPTTSERLDSPEPKKELSEEADRESEG